MKFFKSLMANVDHTSESGKLNSKDAFSIARQALFVGLGAAAAFIATKIPGLDLGPYTLVIVPAVQAGLNSLQKWLADNQEPKAE